MIKRKVAKNGLSALLFDLQESRTLAEALQLAIHYPHPLFNGQRMRIKNLYDKRFNDQHVKDALKEVGAK